MQVAVVKLIISLREVYVRLLTTPDIVLNNIKGGPLLIKVAIRLIVLREVRDFLHALLLISFTDLMY